MHIERFMKRTVVTVKPLDSVLHARELMERHRVNQLPVVVDGRVVGILTDRDVRDAFPSVFERARPRRRKDAETDPACIPIEDVMSPVVVTLPPDASVADAARLLRRERFGAVPVVEDERLCGILTRSDLLDALVAVTEGEQAAARG